jgi:acylphosphatase
MVRAEVVYSGYVQGVGFRYTARSIAGRHGVTGFVRNLSNGNVELMAEGNRGEIEAFLADLASVMEGHIDNIQISWTQPAGEFKGFGIRF